MKILNLYAGIGGNRKNWGDQHEIIAVEYDPKIAEIYKSYFPNDKVVVADAHQYLQDHYHEFDFIWSSPPCPSHSKVRFANQIQNKPIFPDLKLYEEVLFLMHYFKGQYCVENVVSFYDPLIPPQLIGKHYFWANFSISQMGSIPRGMGNNENLKNLYKLKGFDLTSFSGIDKMKTIRNCVEPELGEHILSQAIKKSTLF